MDARFVRNADRLRHADALALLIGKALFDAPSVPASPINNRKHAVENVRSALLTPRRGLSEGGRQRRWDKCRGS